LLVKNNLIFKRLLMSIKKHKYKKVLKIHIMKIIKIKIVAVIALFIGLAISSCSNTANNMEEHEEKDEMIGGISVSLTQQQMDAINLKLVEIEERNMTIGIQVTGQLELAPQDRADISPILGGIVKKIYVFEGDNVKKGQVLASLEHPDFIQLQQDYINSVNNLEYLNKEFYRQKKLYEEEVGSGREFQKVSAEYNNMISIVKGLKIRLAMLGIDATDLEKGSFYSEVTIVSPMKGSISLVETNIGAYVEPLTRLFEVVNNEELHADFRVYEKDINKVKVGQKVFFTTTSQDGEEFEAIIHAISPVFEDNPKSLHVHADIHNDNRSLLPGMYIQGRIIAERVLAMVLPEDAIVMEDNKSYIFVVTDEEMHEDDDHDDHEEEKTSFRMVEVITGLSNGGYIGVSLVSPIEEDAEIAGSGAYYLLAESGKEETEHSH
jgi:cobalt-zinc-cadmium efflux system membrane fusion protein